MKTCESRANHGGVLVRATHRIQPKTAHPEYARYMEQYERGELNYCELCVKNVLRDFWWIESLNPTPDEALAMWRKKHIG